MLYGEAMPYLGLHVHSAHPLTHPEQLPVPLAPFHGKCLIQVYNFNFFAIWLCYLYYVEICLGTEMITLVLHLPTVFAAQQRAVCRVVARRDGCTVRPRCVAGSTPEVCVGARCDVCTVVKSPTDTFLRTYSRD